MVALFLDDIKTNDDGDGIPWVPEVFLAGGGNFRCWPKADTSSAVGRSHEGSDGKENGKK